VFFSILQKVFPFLFPSDWNSVISILNQFQSVFSSICGTVYSVNMWKHSPLYKDDFRRKKFLSPFFFFQSNFWLGQYHNYMELFSYLLSSRAWLFNLRAWAIDFTQPCPCSQISPACAFDLLCSNGTFSEILYIILGLMREPLLQMDSFVKGLSSGLGELWISSEVGGLFISGPDLS